VQGINTLLNNDFRGQSTVPPGTLQYTYDSNGNMTADANKGITVTYNALNLPAVITKSAGTLTKYMYDASGRKLFTRVYENGSLKTTTDYCGALVYENLQIQYIQTSEGRIAYLYSTSPINTQTQTGKGATVATVTQRFEYFLTDHLGNTRVVFTKGSDGTAQTVQEDHYYPFGLQLSGQSFTNTTLLNKYLFNGKEKQDQTGMYDYGFRQMDPVLGRWFCVDAMAESYMSSSPYAYCENNPVNRIDILGLWGEDDGYGDEYDEEQAYRSGHNSSENSNNGHEGDPLFPVEGDYVYQLGDHFEHDIKDFLSSFGFSEFGTFKESDRDFGDGNENPDDLPIYPNIPTLSGSEYDAWPTEHGYMNNSEMLEKVNEKGHNGIYDEFKYYRIPGRSMHMSNGTMSVNTYARVKRKHATLTRVKDNPPNPNNIYSPGDLSEFDRIINDKDNNTNSTFQIQFLERFSLEADQYYKLLLQYYQKNTDVIIQPPVQQDVDYGYPIIFNLNYLTW
jgi:RHS repeat-associated protein